MEPSLTDGFEDAPTFANYGSGAQNLDTGVGSLCNHQNDGPVNQYVDTNHIGSSSDFTAFGDNSFRFQAETIKRSVNVYSAQSPQYKFEEHEVCLHDLFVTDPFEDKKALKRKKGDRVAGTCEWILGTKELIVWLGPSQKQDSVSDAHQVLWLHGNPGTGKSMLAIYLTDVLSDRFSAADGHTLAYFFCDSAFDTQRTATSVVRGLLWQLVEHHPQLLSYVLPKYKERKTKLFESFDALWTIFIAAAADRDTGRKYCLIDALDECDDDSQKTLLRQLRETFHGPDVPPNVQILVTSRPYPEIRNHLERFTHQDLASFPDVQRDIEQCIKERVAQLKYAKETEMQVTESLRDKAEGTFLWAGIACNELEATPSKDAISCLEVMPRGLDSLYEKLSKASLDKETEKDTIRLILGFVAVSRRPLNLLELADACRLGQDEADIEARTQFMRKYIESCRLLVVIQDDKVLLLHQSVKDYLIKVGKQTGFSELEAHADFAHRCLECLVEQFRSPKEAHGYLSDYATREWPNHARMAQSSFAAVMAAQAEFFNVISPCRESWLAAYRARTNKFSFNELPRQFSILHVAARWGIPAIAEHVSNLYDQHGKAGKLFNSKDSSDETALDCAIRIGYATVVRVLLDLGSLLTRNSTLLAAGNGANAKEVMALLLQQRGSEITITEEVVAAAAGNWRNGKEVMALLLKQRGNEITITEEVMNAAAGNWGNGKEVMALLLDRRGSEITITEKVVKTAAGNWGNPKEVMALLLDQRGNEITITEEVFKAAAGNWGNGKEVMALLLQQQGSEITITEEVVKAAAGNEQNGKEVMALLLDRRGSEITITEEVMKAAAGNEQNGKKVMALLLDRRGSEITITEEVMKAAAGNEQNGKEVMALLLDRRGSEITITEEVAKAAAGDEETVNKAEEAGQEAEGRAAFELIRKSASIERKETEPPSNTAGEEHNLIDGPALFLSVDIGLNKSRARCVNPGNCDKETVCNIRKMYRKLSPTFYGRRNPTGIKFYRVIPP
ncbi:hypothetical protein G3M48_005358 [Beauveria asiatica]|uniref:NACHT domain-containing protein n=1 Tax=Beauveria asiatica TaxID=1069075 RepID=A0AAW0RRT9_9HYPO